MSRSSKPRSATFKPRSANRKLGPVVLEETNTLPRPRAVAPYVCVTYASIAATCSNNCPFKNNGCYVQSGYTKFMAAKLDAAAYGLTADEVNAEEAALVHRAFHGGRIPQDGYRRRGRDLRLHVGGDVASDVGARALAGAASSWRDRGGGSIWTFSHSWRSVSREAWGSISVLASVELPEDIEEARQAGYAAAIVVSSFPSKTRFNLPGSTAGIIPCPAETHGKTCAECRLCLDRDLLKMNRAIAFQKHGPGKKQVEAALIQLRRRAAP